ncbi:MAG: endonuclease/exonuclease/phosphatase [Rhodospirillaceae bacterium]|nr:endonuclease/exonuclease/phosphatase [Rhodospirillaceae bacterium]
MAIRSTFTCVAIAAVLLAEPTAAAELKIAAWNIEHLAEKNGEGCRPRDDKDYAVVSKYVKQLNADVIAIQEIDNGAAAARVFDPATYTIEMGDQPKRPGYECKRGDSTSGISTQQHVGFAIKKGIPYVRNADFKDLDVNGLNSLRWGVDITLTGKKPLRLLSVHMKASCPAQPLATDTQDCKTLLKQQPVLEEQWIEKRYAEGKAFMVIGDFNRHFLTPGDEFWALTNDHSVKSLPIATPPKVGTTH